MDHLPSLVSISLAHDSGSVDDGIVKPQHREERTVAGSIGILTAGGDSPVMTSSDASDRSRLLMALDEAGGNRIAAAKALGVGRSTLYRRMVKLGIPTRRK